MDTGSTLANIGGSGGALLVGALVAVAVLFMWLAFRPGGPAREVRQRLDGYVERTRALEESDLSKPFLQRAVWPPLRRLLGFFGRMLPRRSVETTQQLLLQAGEPGGLTPLDYFGIQIMVALLLAGAFYVLAGRSQPLMYALRGVLVALLLGYALPWYWLRSKGRRRSHRILRALPDALDMLTVGVEAGLAFESAMLRVAEKWDNPLTREFRRAVVEMRVGTSREEALWRMVQRAGVPDLRTFVAVLNQSSQLGVSIAQVLHTQAAQMRQRRRQRAEELARQAGVKMIFPLGIFIFPAMLVVILGPAIPLLTSFFASLSGSGGGFP